MENKGEKLVLGTMILYTIGVLFLNSSKYNLLSPINQDISQYNYLKFIPFIFLIIAGILVIIHIKHIKVKEKNKVTKRYDKIIIIIGILGPLASIPQIYQIWFNQSALGVSVVSWTIFMSFGFIWLGYGMIHKYKPIIITNSLWVFLDSFIILGALLY